MKKFDSMKVKLLRVENGLNQGEFGKIINKSRAYVCWLETNHRKVCVDADTLALMCDKFDKDLSYFFVDDSHKV